MITSAVINLSAITSFDDNFEQTTMNNRAEVEKIEPEQTF